MADTSCLYAAFDVDDAHHAEARQELARPGPLVVPAEVLVETAGLVTGRVGREVARSVVVDLRALPHAEFTHRTDLWEALRLRDEHPELSLVDASVVWHARRLGCRAATFDARILRLTAT